MYDEEERRGRHATGSSGQLPEQGLARKLGEMARDLQAEQDMSAVLKRITATAVDEVEGADYAGISLIEGPRIRSEAETDDVVTRIDDEQYRLQEGPCLTSLREQETVRCNDFAGEARWPQFAAASIALGVRAMLSVQLFVDRDNLGALNLYATTTRAFTDHDESTAMLLAAHAAIAMKASSDASNLRRALESRDRIGQAKGILMERFKISEIQAFDLLVVASQRRQLKLRDVADELAATGELKTS